MAFPASLDISAENLPSNRSFGVFFAAVFGAVGLWGLYALWDVRVTGGLLVAGGLCGTLAVAWPALLRPLNIAWYLLGMVLGAIVNPLVMGVLFFGVLTPLALGARLVGRDELRLKGQPDAKTHWLERDPPGPAPDSYRNQF